MGVLGRPWPPPGTPKTIPKSTQKTSENNVAARWPPRALQDSLRPPTGRPKTPRTPPRTPSRTPGGAPGPLQDHPRSDLKIVLSLLSSCRRVKGKTSIEIVDHMLHNRNLRILATSSQTVVHKLDGGGGVRAQRILDPPPPAQHAVALCKSLRNTSSISLLEEANAK